MTENEERRDGVLVPQEPFWPGEDPEDRDDAALYRAVQAMGQRMDALPKVYERANEVLQSLHAARLSERLTRIEDLQRAADDGPSPE